MRSGRIFLSTIMDWLVLEDHYGHIVNFLLEDDTCHFLAIDFDDAEWKEGVRAFV